MRAEGSQSHQVARHIDQPTPKVGNELATMLCVEARQGNPTDKASVAIPLWKKISDSRIKHVTRLVSA